MDLLANNEEDSRVIPKKNLEDSPPLPDPESPQIIKT